MKQGATKIYTKTGDKGKTSLIGGTRVHKAHPRLEAYGTLDELNSILGLVISQLNEDQKTADSFSEKPWFDLRASLECLSCIQINLFNIGSQLACEDESIKKTLPKLKSEAIADLENEMDRLSENLSPLRNFILPGGTKAASLTHMARTVCRRAERHCVALVDTLEEEERGDDPHVIYINRLSDYLFVLARAINQVFDQPETPWKP